MKKLNPVPEVKEPNFLSEIHIQLTNHVVLFRALVCMQCQWSMPTYYRKIRQGNVSIAEKEMITKLKDMTLRYSSGQLSEEESKMMKAAARFG